jgi:hypothetical protein
MLMAGMKNLLISQDVFSMEEFTVKILEREKYLKGAQGSDDVGNGKYLRSFKALNKNSLLVNIPRSRSSSPNNRTIKNATRAS